MLLTILATELTLIFNTLICHVLLERRKSVSYCIYAFICFSMVISLLIAVTLTVFGRTPLAKYIYFLLNFCYIFYIHMIYKESFPKKLFTMFSAWILTNIILLVCLYIVDTYSSIGSESMYLLIVSILRIIIQLTILLFSYIFLRKSYKQSIRLIDNKTAYLICLYSIIIVLYLLENFNFETNSYAYNGFMSILLLTFFVFSGYTLVGIIIASVSKTLTLRNNFNIIENQLNLQRHNYDSLSKAIEKYSILKHDMRHHAIAIKSMLHSGNYGDALKYIEQFNDSKTLQDPPIVCKNFTVDSFVKYYMAIASDKNIKFNTKLNIPEDINISSTDLCIIMGNAIENAINACNKMDNNNKHIHLTSNILGANLVIKIINSFNGEIKKDGDRFISTSHEGQGLGLLSITTLAEKYKGYVDIKYTDEVFEIAIVMNLETISELHVS